MTGNIQIKLNHISLKKLLATVLSLQIALWIIMGFSALGISIPIVQPLLGFIYLTFVPGILILTALRQRMRIVEIILYAVGLSVAVVLFVGFAVNIIFSAVNVIEPFSFLAIASSVSFVVLLLCCVAYYRNRPHYSHVSYAPGSAKRWINPIPMFTAEMSAPLAPTLFLCILPFMSVLSTYLVNTYNVAGGSGWFFWLMPSIVVLLIVFDVIPPKLYPLAIFTMSFPLLFQNSLNSEWLIGADIQTEWSLANSVLSTGVWNPNLLSQYNGMLSVVALAPIYSLITSLSLVWVFKIVYAVIFALVPVVLFQIFRRQLNHKVAFLSCFLFVSFAGFYSELPALARQEVAEFFCVLLILLLVSTEMNKGIQSALFVVFGLSMVVSHYGLTYMIVFLLFITWLILTVGRFDRPKQMPRYLRKKFGNQKDKRIVAASPKPPPRTVLTIMSISILFIATIAWYTYTAQATVIQAILSLGNHIAGSVGEMLNPTYSQAVNVVQEGPLPGMLHKLNAYVNYLNVFFIITGLCLAIFLKKQRYKLQLVYVVLSAVALGFLTASVIVPWLGAALNWVRVFQITLIVLAPFLAIGFITVGETVGVMMRKATNKLGFDTLAILSRSRLTQLLAIYLVLFMLLSNGFLFAIAQGYPLIRPQNEDNGITHQTIVGATWATRLAYDSGTTPLSDKRVTILHYFNNIPYDDANRLTNADGQIAFTQTFDANGSYTYYATFASDGVYETATSAGVNVNVGSNRASNQPPMNIGPQTTLSLSASNTTPAVGQPVTFTVTLTSGKFIYGDYYIGFLLNALAPTRGQFLPPPQNGSTGDFYIFLSTYNIKHNEALIHHLAGVNKYNTIENVTPFISDRSLIYSNGGASVYS